MKIVVSVGNRDITMEADRVRWGDEMTLHDCGFGDPTLLQAHTGYVLKSWGSRGIFHTVASKDDKP